ncbi:hypothetical protein SLA2020_440930 [Shorea laevis]
MEFEKASFWVRMYNLPLACISKEIGFSIGASMGLVEEVDTAENGVGWGEYLRVKIKLDLSKPLLRGRMLKLPRTSVWIAFQYEKIPKFYFKCGVIRHGASRCFKLGGRRFQGEEKGSQFGTWLRATSPKRWNGARHSRTNRDLAHSTPRISREDEVFYHAPVERPPCQSRLRSSLTTRRRKAVRMKPGRQEAASGADFQELI